FVNLQENRYAVMDVCYPQSPVGFIREQSNVLARQFLRTRRPFVACITDGLGNELFRVRRPFWWINSSIYGEINGKEVGVVHRRWHLWKRIYDLYLGRDGRQEGSNLWALPYYRVAVEFNSYDRASMVNVYWCLLISVHGGPENIFVNCFGPIFTDAGQYVIRFGNAYSSICPITGIQELEVARPLILSERAVAVALAISLDNDYFSRHGGWGIPFVVVSE
uniref:Phospholipid scramblase n=1 Tax=Nicotiana tabacum TaxID=4097 RepID=A0A1S4CVN5_TOBAC